MWKILARVSAVLMLTGALATWFCRSPCRDLSLDILAALEPPPPALRQSGVLILGVDADTFREYGEAAPKDQPRTRVLDRRVFIRVLEKLASLKTAVIGLDVAFRHRRNADIDAQLARAIAACGNVVVVGSWVAETPARVSWSGPLPEIQSAARAIAAANLPPDPDGVIRRVPLQSQFSPKVDPLCLAISKQVLHNQYVTWGPGRCLLSNARPFPDLEIPLDEQGSLLIRPLKGPTDGAPFTVIPVTRFLRLPPQKIPRELFESQTVLIGATDPLFGDCHRFTSSRFSGRMVPGVELQGTAVHDILEARFFSRPPDIVLATLGILLVYLTARLCAARGFLLALILLPALLLGLIGGSYGLYQAGFLVSVVDCGAPVVLAALLGSIWNSSGRSRAAGSPIQNEKQGDRLDAFDRSRPNTTAVDVFASGGADRLVWTSDTLLSRGGTPSLSLPEVAPFSFSPEFLKRFRIERPLGRGAMGEVFLATQLALSRRVAVKVLTSLRPDRRARFRTEGNLLSRLNHPRIVSVHDAGEDRDVPYLVCEFVDGVTLSQRLKDRPLPLSEGMVILLEILEGLAVAHGEGILHRDIKPENIFLDTAGHVKIGDFGLARTIVPEETALTQDGAILGSPIYMSPEQCKGKPADARSDVYSVGVVAYQLLSGRLPFAGGTVAEWLAQHVAIVPVPIREVCPEVPERVAAAVMTALNKAPEARFPDAAALRAALGPG